MALPPDHGAHAPARRKAGGHPIHRRTGRTGAFVLGVALSGLFDGILLHQVLQWHHLLSLVPGRTFRDLRTQIYADGLFHVATYAVALVGLVMLWRARRGIARSGAGNRIFGFALMGFGAWNVADVVLFHWIFGIHRVRIGVPQPLVYDIAWLIALGFAFLAAGWAIARRDAAHDIGGSGALAALLLVGLVGAAAPIASLPARGGTTLVLFRPNFGAARAINAAVAADARIVLLDPDGNFAIVELPAASHRRALYRAGAWLVSDTPALAGCLATTA